MWKVWGKLDWEAKPIQAFNPQPKTHFYNKIWIRYPLTTHKNKKQKENIWKVLLKEKILVNNNLFLRKVIIKGNLRWTLK